MTHFFYNSLMRLLLPLVLFKMKRRAAKVPEYGIRWDERLSKKNLNVLPHGVLFHVASLGEAIACTPIIQQFMAANPRVSVTVTSITPTGSEQILKTFGDSVVHCYMPFDLPLNQARFIARIKPRLLILMETELWPNLICCAKKSGAKVMIINGRLSEKSTKRYLKFSRLTRLMMQNIDAVAAQFESDAQRFVRIGTNPRTIYVTGNIKSDTRLQAKDYALALNYQAQWQLKRPVWVAASTHEGEEELIFAAHASLLKSLPNVLLIVVPRHCERFDAAVKSAQQLFNCQRKSNLSLLTGLAPDVDTQVIVGDSLGEMMLYIALADIVFMGGSLVEAGGHNPFEAACQQKAILVGPHYANFANSYRELLVHEAVRCVHTSEQLQQQLLALIQQPKTRAHLASKAHTCQQLFAGSQQRTLDLINAEWLQSDAQQVMQTYESIAVN